MILKFIITSLVALCVLIFHFFFGSTPAEKNDPAVSVLLDGSCDLNNNGWRDIVIPALQGAGIPYINSNCTNVVSELLNDKEKLRKEVKTVFFDIESDERNSQNLVDLANLLTMNYDSLYAVLPTFEIDQEVGEIIDLDVNELNQAVKYLQEILDSHSTPYFMNTTDGIDRLIQDKKKQAKAGNKAVAFKQPGKDKGDIERLFNGKAQAGQISLQQATEIFTGEVSSCKPDAKSVCAEYNKFAIPADTSKLNCQDLTSAKVQFKMFKVLHDNFSLMKKASSSDEKCAADPDKHNFYVKAEANELETVNIAITSYLYNNAPVETLNILYPTSSDKTFKDELKFFQNSRLILFVIKKTNLSVKMMLEAAYLMGQKARLVLVIEDLDINTRIGTDMLTEAAVKDYNKARSYLRRLAALTKTPFFNDLNSALAEAFSEYKKT